MYVKGEKKMCRKIKIIFGAIKLVLCKFLSIFVNKKDLWLVCEKTNEARDNGYYFFEYAQKSNDTNVFYVIDKYSYDFNRIQKYQKQIIYTNSLKHCLYYFKSSKLISSQAMPFPFSETLCKKIFKVKGQKYYWLQHGVTKDKLNHKDMDYSVKEYSLVCCASKKEVDFFKEEFGYNDKNAKLTGFCRFDGLENVFEKNNSILIMPTHRKWLNTNTVTSTPTEKEEKRFLESEFYKEYSSILTNNELLNMLKKNNTKIIFYIHYALQVYSYLFKKFENEYVIIAQSDLFDVQDLLRESKVLITDYSSVFFDFAYMKKPVLYYQFDIDRYRENHYKEGYFSYKDDGFGEVCLDKNSLQKSLVKIIKNNYQMEKRYIQRVDDFFDVIDRNNCERIYSYIKGEEN